MSQWVFIEASDVWLFRDNKPFSAQQNFVAQGQFPPTPMTIQGAVRTHFLENMLPSEGRSWDDYRHGNVSSSIIQTVGLPAFNGQPAIQGALHITGPFVARLNSNGTVERLLRAPLDLLALKSEKTNPETYDYKVLTPVTEYDFATEPPFNGWCPLEGGGHGYKEAQGWLSESDFINYLKGNVSEVKHLADEEVFTHENRVGLALDYNRRAHIESMFYQAEFVRPCDQVGLLIHVDHPIFTGSGYLSLGGESRSGHFQVVNNIHPLPQTGRGKVRIVLLTPAYFTGGWAPENHDWSPWVGDGALVSAAVGKPHAISGWDMAARRPKPLRHYVPAGSVFFFENADVKGIPFTETPHSSPDHGAMGFGTFAVGLW